MSEPRMLPLEPPYAPEVAGELEAMMPPGVEPIRLFRTLARSPRILGKVRAANLLDRGSLERRHREIVILRATARCGAEYEWGIHVSVFARRFGLTGEQIAASVHGGPDDPAWEPRDRLLVRLVDELHDGAGVSDALWKQLAACFAEEQILELLVLAGFYHTISFVVNALHVEPEAAAERFPAPPA